MEAYEMYEEKLKEMEKKDLEELVIELQNKNKELKNDKELFFNRYMEEKQRGEALTSIVKSLSQLLD